MNRAWRELVLVATRGTSRAGLPAPAGALAQALQSVPGDTPEALLLGRAALLGLHARAEAELLPVSAPPPDVPPAPDHPLPGELFPPLRGLAGAGEGLARGALEDIRARGWTLSAAQLLSLDRPGSPLAGLLWAVADARARALLDSHPLREQAQLADEGDRWSAVLAAVRERRRHDPAEAARTLLVLWDAEAAPNRRELLALMEDTLTPADRPVLERAARDRSPEVQRRARQLLGHLPGPVQEELLTLLPRAVRVDGRRVVTFQSFDLPDALARPRPSAPSDTPWFRLLAALPTPLVLERLGLSFEELKRAARHHHPHLPRALQEPGGTRSESPEPGADAGPANEAALEALYTLVRREGMTQLAHLQAARLARELPADHAPAPPTPAPFTLPPCPPDLARRLAPGEWEEHHRRAHAEAEQAVTEVWRDLCRALDLRREWQRALAAYSLSAHPPAPPSVPQGAL